MQIDPGFLELLACPQRNCGARLEQRGESLCCVGCGARYPVEARWPVLIPDEAELAEGRPETAPGASSPESEPTES